MSVKLIAAETAERIKAEKNWFYLFNRPALSRAHLLNIAAMLESGEIYGESAFYWLGWLQAGANAGNVTVDQINAVNKAAV